MGKANQDAHLPFSRNGEVELIDHMGSDNMVVNAARVSHAKHERYAAGDCADVGGVKIIRHMALSHPTHWTPFAHPQLTFLITAPMFVANQLYRHVIGVARNEISRRYVDDAPEFCSMEWRVRPPKSIKQGSGEPFTESEQAEIQEFYEELCEYALEVYDQLDGMNVAPELMRAVLPMGMMTSWYWTGSLYFFAGVCKHRLDMHAQKETRWFAEQFSDTIASLFPVSWDALSEGLGFKGYLSERACNTDK